MWPDRALGSASVAASATPDRGTAADILSRNRRSGPLFQVDAWPGASHRLTDKPISTVFLS
jgi:hypothetical protein